MENNIIPKLKSGDIKRGRDFLDAMHDAAKVALEKDRFDTKTKEDDGK